MMPTRAADVCANAAPVCYSDTAIGEELHGIQSFAPLHTRKLYENGARRA